MHLSVPIIILATFSLVYFFLNFQINSFIFTDLATLSLLGLKIIAQINAVNINVGNLVSYLGLCLMYLKYLTSKLKKLKKYFVTN